MGKFERNYDDVDRDREGGYDGEVPVPGIYDARLSSVQDHTTSETSTVWTFDITEEPYAGWRGWVYTNAEGAAWKEVQILEAVGLLAPGEGKFKGTHEKIMAKAGPCRVKVKNETYEGEKRGKITTILAPSGGSKKKGKKDKKTDDPF